MLVTFELVEAGAGWGKQDDIAGLSVRGGPADCRTQSFRVNDLARSFNLRFDLCGRGANRIYALHSFSQQIGQNRIVAVFIFTTENEVNVRRK